MYSVDRLYRVFEKLREVKLEATESILDGTENHPDAEKYKIYEDLLNLEFKKRLTVVVGSRGCGIEDYLKKFEDTNSLIVINPSSFSTEMTYTRLKGSSPGYVGSDRPTSFAKSISTPGKSYVILVDGTSGIDASLFEEFIDSFVRGTFTESTGHIGDINVTRHKLVVFIPDMIDRPLLPDELFDRVLKKETTSADRPSLSRPVFTKGHLSEFDIRQVPELYHRPDLVKKIPEYLPVKNFDILQEAIHEFKLVNREIIGLAPKDLKIDTLEDEYLLVVDGKVEKQKRIITELTYSRFLDELEKYYSQEDAVLSFKQAIAHKISHDSPRPVSIFCAGPPGVGKTYLSKLLGNAVGSFARIDANLVTSPQDIFESSSFTKQLNTNSANVILVDEVEKMPKPALLSLLQLLDEGRLLNSSTGEVYELSESIIIFTSNAIDRKMTEEEARNSLREYGFPREFVDRLNYVATFRDFSPEEAIHLAQKMKGRKLSDYEKNKLSTVKSMRQLKVELDKLESMEKVKRLDKKLSQHSKSSGKSRTK